MQPDINRAQSVYAILSLVRLPIPPLSRLCFQSVTNRLLRRNLHQREGVDGLALLGQAGMPQTVQANPTRQLEQSALSSTTSDGTSSFAFGESISFPQSFG